MHIFSIAVAVVKPDQPIQKKVKYGISITQAVLDTENTKVEDSITRVSVNLFFVNFVIIVTRTINDITLQPNYNQGSAHFDI